MWVKTETGKLVNLDMADTVESSQSLRGPDCQSTAYRVFAKFGNSEVDLCWVTENEVDSVMVRISGLIGSGAKTCGTGTNFPLLNKEQS